LNSTQASGIEADRTLFADVYGMHGSFKAVPGEGDALAAILLEAAEAARRFDGCLLYMVSRGIEDPDTIWVTEAWTDRAAHATSLERDDTRALIARARPLIAEMPGHHEFEPLGGMPR
jgi:quinol monooxygenase YgiN